MQTFVQSRMGVTKVASHTLSPFSKKCKLKRGPKNYYVFDTMNLLYSMCGISVIADLLMQKPPVPTRETVRFTLSVLFCAWFKLIFACICLQTFAYLDRWCKTHNFDATNTKKEKKTCSYHLRCGRSLVSTSSKLPGKFLLVCFIFAYIVLFLLAFLYFCFRVCAFLFVHYLQEFIASSTTSRSEKSAV